MNSLTTKAAVQYRLGEWAAQIRDCQNRPEGMSVVQWCSQNGITKANYYYRLRRVRKSCLEDLPEEMIPQPVVPVPAGLLDGRYDAADAPGQGLDISMKDFSIHVTEHTSMKLLAEVLEVVRGAQ